MIVLNFSANSAKQSLVKVLQETDELLSLKENDFAWSPWENLEDANAEIRKHITRLEADDFSGIENLKLLFAPTGAIQEISVSSGWGEKFLALAKKFDRTVARLKF
jgi:hypothetical protein